MEPHFSILGIPVRVHFSFIIIIIMLGASQGATAISIGVWLVVAFIGVMMHELGHALTGRAFGLQPSISLYGMGGLTSWVAGRKVSAGKSFLISIAGPAVGIAVGLPLLIWSSVAGPLPPLASSAIQDAIWVNLGWGVLNLVPVMPLDGGNALKAFFGIIGIKQAELVARIISIVVGVGLGLLILVTSPGSLWGLMLLAMFTFQNVQGLRASQALGQDQRILDHLRANFDGWVASNQGARLIQEGSLARVNAKTTELAAYATEVVAMGQCLTGDPQSALATLGALPRGYAPSWRTALHILVAAGQVQTALDYISRLLEDHSLSPEDREQLLSARARLT